MGRNNLTIGAGNTPLVSGNAAPTIIRMYPDINWTRAWCTLYLWKFQGNPVISAWVCPDSQLSVLHPSFIHPFCVHPVPFAPMPMKVVRTSSRRWTRVPHKSDKDNWSVFFQTPPRGKYECTVKTVHPHHGLLFSAEIIPLS